jgi:flagellar biosynthesis/type III secretory pathway protein FliH
MEQLLTIDPAHFELQQARAATKKSKQRLALFRFAKQLRNVRLALYDRVVLQRDRADPDIVGAPVQQAVDDVL